MYGLPRCGQPLLNDTRLLWNELILGRLHHWRVDVQLATQAEGTHKVHLMTSDESALDGEMLKDGRTFSRVTSPSTGASLTV